MPKSLRRALLVPVCLLLVAGCSGDPASSDSTGAAGTTGAAGNGAAGTSGTAGDGAQAGAAG
ncbi:MAG TPA: hypothetical protein VHB21_27260, partial [Minicystis sp.]|nr:hypothetical protein [Minicystis sp.]